MSGRVYAREGHGYLVCPALLELDARHGRHWAKHPDCAHGRPCIRDHKHEKALPDGGGHRVADFHWPPGARVADHDLDALYCGCGRQLVHGDLLNPWDAQHLAPEADPLAD